ncbi:transcriptional regulator, GntR family [Modicisalibacter muralis]|uniref:Transcriptional regulator, GntR family n=1 Tax=Modicisalibacter muralis TaxID=119000 RepID=A0A1G9IDN8_9GAMM|nr:FadR/GntR family transcriptional regulator [Halomonas muralis]SDL23368.1 transcriptional regulator, GntR family [Halomonas muralis]
MQLTHVGRQSLVESVIARLRETIERGTWQVGERIPVEADLARDLGVSRNTVREAVRVLVHAGLMETRQGAGTFVRASRDPGETLRTIERTELHEQLEVRLTLEVEAARLAALRHDADDLAVMRDALTARAAAGGDIQARIRHDERFHLAVMQAAHNRALLTLYLYFAHAVIRTIERTEHDADLPEPSQADHEALFAAIERRDAEGAVQAARHLLQPSLDVLAEE